MPMQKGEVELYDMDAELKHETEDAFLVTDGADDYWLPKSLTEKFGPTPERAVADEAVKLWQKIFLEVGA